MLLVRWKEVEEITAKAQGLAPGKFSWTVNLGHIYLLQGKREQAQLWYRRALPLIPDEASLRFAPLADFDLFVEPDWQAEGSREARDWFDGG